MEDFQEILNHAKLIPSDDIYKDLDCLEELFRKSPIYFDFCYSWFTILLKKGHNNQIINKLEQMVQNELEPNRYLPLLDIILANSDPEESSTFIISLISSHNKLDNVSSSILIHPSFQKMKIPLLTKLFNIFPNETDAWQITQIRDNLLFRCLSSGNQNKLALNCLMRIPATFSTVFYHEFLKIATYMIENGCNDPLLSILIINLICTDESKLPLILILANSTLPIPQLFIDYLTEDQIIKDKQSFPEFNQKSIIESDFDSIPPFLRRRKILPHITKLDGPRLCRIPTNQKNRLWNEIIQQRIHNETDPKMLHDYLIASLKVLPLKSPFRFTLLANAAYNDPNLMNVYYSEFSSLNPECKLDYLLAASKGLEKLSYKDTSAAVVTFPVIRGILNTCSDKRVRNCLLNSIAYSVGDNKIDAEFVWRDYHSIRTIPNECLDFEDLIHYSIIALDDPLEADVAESLITILHKKEFDVVESGLWRLPTEIIEKHPSILELMPKNPPGYSLKDDKLPQILNEELQKEPTTQRMLQIASAFTMFFDAFDFTINNESDSKQLRLIKFPIVDWMKILIQAGSTVYNMKIDEAFFKDVKKLMKSDNEKVRFSCIFSIALFISYRIIDPIAEYALCVDLRNCCLNDTSKSVRLIALYTTSLCPPPSQNSEISANQFIKNIIDRGRGRNSLEDLIGIGYVIRSWFSHITKLIESNPKWRNSPYLWPFMIDLEIFFRSNRSKNQDFIVENDDVGLAQFIFMQKHNSYFDTVSDTFAKNEHLSHENLLVAVCGFVPSLAFRINEFSPDERQRKIIQAGVGDEFNLINELLTRKRMPHKPVQKVKTDKQNQVRSLTERLKSDWMKMENEEVQLILSALSNEQIGEIIKDQDQDYSLFTAVSKKLIPETARLLCARRWSNEMLKRVNSTFVDDNFTKLVTEMCELNAKIERLADLIVFHNINELLDEEKSVSLLSSYLAEITPMNIKIVNYGKKLPYFANCLILVNPSFFENNEEEAFTVFD